MLPGTQHDDALAVACSQEMHLAWEDWFEAREFL
jgi:hypothetical protein